MNPGAMTPNVEPVLPGMPYQGQLPMQPQEENRFLEENFRPMMPTAPNPNRRVRPRQIAGNPQQMAQLDQMIGMDDPALGPNPGAMPPPWMQGPTDPMREAPPNPGQGSPFRDENEAMSFLQQLMGPRVVG
jgi:hypothetical protein